MRRMRQQRRQPLHRTPLDGLGMSDLSQAGAALAATTKHAAIGAREPPASEACS